MSFVQAISGRLPGLKRVKIGRYLKSYGEANPFQYRFYEDRIESFIIKGGAPLHKEELSRIPPSTYEFRMARYGPSVGTCLDEEEFSRGIREGMDRYDRQFEANTY